MGFHSFCMISIDATFVYLFSDMFSIRSRVTTTTPLINKNEGDFCDCIYHMKLFIIVRKQKVGQPFTFTFWRVYIIDICFLNKGSRLHISSIFSLQFLLKCTCKRIQVMCLICHDWLGRRPHPGFGSPSHLLTFVNMNLGQ